MQRFTNRIYQPAQLFFKNFFAGIRGLADFIAAGGIVENEAGSAAEFFGPFFGRNVGEQYIKDSGIEELDRDATELQRRYLGSIKSSRLVGNRLGRYGVAYDRVVNGVLIKGATAAKTQEDYALEQSSKVAYNVLLLGRRIVESWVSAKEAFEKAIVQLNNFHNEVRVNGSR